MTILIDCISDLHGDYPDLPGGDLLIVAGDLTLNGFAREYLYFEDWLFSQVYEKIIFIAGNHDKHLELLYKHNSSLWIGKLDDTNYLCDSGTEFRGLKIWGSPWTPTFYNWSFMKDRGRAIKEKWDLIPKDTDILITHGPPRGILDLNGQCVECGCDDLLKAVLEIKPKLHVFGHIHESYGKIDYDLVDTTFVNASHNNGVYHPINKPIRIELV